MIVSVVMSIANCGSWSGDLAIGDAVRRVRAGLDRSAGVDQRVEQGLSDGGVDHRDLADRVVQVGGLGVQDDGRPGSSIARANRTAVPAAECGCMSAR